MIVDPERYIEHFVNFGSDIITVHFEACNDLSLVIKKIKKFKVKVGVAINPDTEISVLSNHIKNIDMVCLMGVFQDLVDKNLLKKQFIDVRS